MTLSTTLIAGGLWWNRRRVGWMETDGGRALLRRAGVAVAGVLAVALAVGLVVDARKVLTLDFGPVKKVKTRAVETYNYGLGGGYNYVRFVFWKSSMDAALMRPLTGHGIGTNNKVMPYGRPPWYHRHHVSHNTIYTHNEWLNQYPEVGAIGAGLYFAIIAALAWMFARHVVARRAGREYALLLGLAGGILAFLTQTTFDVETRWTGNAVTFWHTVGLAVAASALRLCRDVDLAPAPVQTPPVIAPPVAPAAGLVLASAAAAGIVFCHVYAGRAWRADIDLRQNMAITEAGAPGDPVFSAERAREGDPYSLTNYYKLAYSYLQKNRWDDAFTAYRILQSMAPNYAQIHLNIGVLFRQRGYLYDALWELRRASTIEENIRNHQTVADLLVHETGDWRRAIPHYRRALRILADDPEGKGMYLLWNREALLSSLAEAYLQTGRPDAAERQIRTALALNENHTPSLIHLARLLRIERPAEAAEVVGRILKENPNEPDALLFLLEEAFRGGRLHEAIGWADRLARALPPPPPGDQSLGRHAQAILDVALRCLGERPAGVDPALCLELQGWAFALAGRYENAIPLLQSAFETTRSPGIASRLAQARARAGR
jgi:tetratricopeptide (TPR) repeat protein